MALPAILAYSLPVLMFLYPLAIVLILLTLGGRAFQNDRSILRWTLAFTAAAALFDFLRTLPEGARTALHLEPVITWVIRWLPLAGQGFGWICPALVGLAVGLLMRRLRSAHC